MARAPCKARQADITRALQAAAAAGLQVSRYEVDSTGKVVVFTGQASSQVDDLDRELAEFEARHGDHKAEGHSDGQG